MKCTKFTKFFFPEEVTLQGPRRRKERWSEKIFEEITAINFPNMRKEAFKFRKQRESHIG